MGATQVKNAHDARNAMSFFIRAWIRLRRNGLEVAMAKVLNSDWGIPSQRLQRRYMAPKPITR
jgi:hypothetical protein